MQSTQRVKEEVFTLVFFLGGGGSSIRLQPTRFNGFYAKYVNDFVAGKEVTFGVDNDYV